MPMDRLTRGSGVDNEVGDRRDGFVGPGWPPYVRDSFRFVCAGENLLQVLLEFRVKAHELVVGEVDDVHAVANPLRDDLFVRLLERALR